MGELIRPDIAAWKELPKVAPAPNTLPFYHLVPKDAVGNARFRKSMIEMAIADKEAADELWIMCSRDMLLSGTIQSGSNSRIVPSPSQLSHAP